MQPGDQRRDRAYSIFYVGINLGAFFARSYVERSAKTWAGITASTAAGVGMTVALAIYLYAMRELPPDELHKGRGCADREQALSIATNGAPSWRSSRYSCHHLVLGNLRAQGNTIVLWADDHTDRTIDLVFWHAKSRLLGSRHSIRS